MKELALLTAILIPTLPLLFGGPALPLTAVLVGWAACAVIAALDWVFPSDRN